MHSNPFIKKDESLIEIPCSLSIIVASTLYLTPPCRVTTRRSMYSPIYTLDKKFTTTIRFLIENVLLGYQQLINNISSSVQTTIRISLFCVNLCFGCTRVRIQLIYNLSKDNSYESTASVPQITNQDCRRN